VLGGRGAQSTYVYGPRALTVATLMVELGEIFGNRSTDQGEENRG
jgi:hypothetical protein